MYDFQLFNVLINIFRYLLLSFLAFSVQPILYY